MKSKYEQWCKDTKRSGSIITRSSLYEFFEWYEQNNDQIITVKACSLVTLFERARRR